MQALHPCKVYVHDPFATRGWPAAPGIRNWPLNKYSQEHWLERAMAGHAWRVASAHEADLVLVLSNFSLYCTAHRAYTMKFVWHSLFNDSTLCDGATTGLDLIRTRGDPSCRVRTPPQMLVYTNTECTAPWVGWSSGTGPPSRPRPETLFITDRVAPHKASALRRSIVSPAVVAGPDFLVAERPTSPDAPVAWEQRRLAFFAGHVPRPGVSVLRYRTWQQLRGASDTTCISHNLNCTVGLYAPCAIADEAERAAAVTRLCAQPCTCVNMPCKLHQFCTMPQVGQPVPRPAKSLRRTCKGYRGIDFEAERADMARDTRWISQREYFGHAMTHRFCFAVPGDYWSTTKLSDYIAVGGAGGCIPVIAVPSSARGSLPYADTLDYCAFAYLVSYSAIEKHQLGRVLARLRQVTAAEASAKFEALRHVRSHFIWRARSPGGEPTAADHLLSAACDLARANVNTTAATLAAEKARSKQQPPQHAAARPDGAFDMAAAGILRPGSSCLLG
jgi:hypothetical protein